MDSDMNEMIQKYLSTLKITWSDSGSKLVNGKMFIEKRFIYNYLVKFIGKSDDYAFFETNKNNQFGMIGILLKENLIVVSGNGFIVL